MALELNDIKRELNVTWTDPENDLRIESCWHRAEDILNDKAGKNLNFEEFGMAQQLLFDCIRYLYSDSYAQFLIDYSEELTALNLRTFSAGESGESDA